MKRTPLEPANSVISALGGHQAVADIAGVNKKNVWAWTQPKEFGGTGGIIPTRHQDKLLAWARENGKPVTADSFFVSTKTRTPVLAKQRLTA